MSGVPIALVAGAVTLALSLALPFAVRPLLVRLGIMDVPNERSSHERPVIRGLGLAVLIAMASGGGVALGLAGSGDAGDGSTRFLWAAVIGALAAGLLGLGEDLRGLSVPVRSTLLLVIAAGAAVWIVWIAGRPESDFGWIGGRADVAFPWIPGIGLGGLGDLSAQGAFGILPLWLGAVLAVYAVLFVSSYINVANFMDGLNGISGLHGVVAGLVFAAAGVVGGLWWLVAAGLVLAAGFAGFLPWNLTRPGAFLGDVGSYLLGGATAVTSFAAWAAGVPLLATIGPMIIYFGDVGVTLVKRVRAGHKWDEPHKEHVYQRIQQLGYSHVQASGMAAGCTLLASLLGLASFFVGVAGSLVLLAAGLAVLVVYLALPRILPRR